MREILEQVRNVYFIGIGGIGMSALARYFKAKEYQVAGYDRTLSALTVQLEEQENIPVNYEDREEAIPSEYRDKEHTLVVYTPAIPKDSRQLNYFRQAGFRLYKRSEVLGGLSARGKALCIAGTHGKTTTSTLLAYLLYHSSVGCNAFLGGISVNFGTNLLLNPRSPYIVIEADEFDRSFLHLTPEMAAITSMDEDHLDIYGNREVLVEAFEEFAGKVRPAGAVFLKKGLELKKKKVSGYYAVDAPADCYSDHLRVEGVYSVFDYHGTRAEIRDLRMGVPGRMNVENATLAITLALEAGVTPGEIREALPGFKGVMRRFNIHTTGKVVYIDDYAHHPREIEAVLSAIREIWPEKKLTVAFQPHLYSRTRDLHEWFARSLNIADEVILLDIYPARELPIPGVNAGIISKDVVKPSHIVSKESFLKFVGEEVQEGIFVTLGAGDIDSFVPALRNFFKE